MLVNRKEMVTGMYRASVTILIGLLTISLSQSVSSQNKALRFCQIRYEIASGERQTMISRINKIQKTIAADVDNKVVFAAAGSSGCKDIGEYNVASAKHDNIDFQIIGDFVPQATMVNRIKQKVAVNPLTIEVRRKKGQATLLAKDKDFAIIRAIVYDYAKSSNAISADELSSFCNSLSEDKAPAFFIGRKLHCQ